LKGVVSVTLLGAALIALLAAVLAAFGLPVMESLGLIAEGAFGDRFGLARTLVKSTPLALASLGIVVAWRAGMYNIGGEGQLITGAVGGAWMAKALWGFFGPLFGLAGLAASMVAGGIFGWLAGWLAVRRNVNVVIGTILLNFVAVQILSWAVSGPLKEQKGRVPLSDRIPDAGMLLKLDPQSDLHAGVALALLAAFAASLYLYRTAGGFRLRLVGENPNAARAARIPPGPVQLKAMALSGALCGLAGGVELFGVSAQIGVGFSLGWGFLAIPAALIGGLHPWGVLLSSLFFGAVLAGSESLARFSTSGSAIVLVIQAAAVVGILGFRAIERMKLSAEAGT
jgi:simple sugar transport system permease protein